MAEYEPTLRSLTDRPSEQWACWLLGQPPNDGQLLESTLPTLERQVDPLLQAKVRGKRFLQHTEFQPRHAPRRRRSIPG